MPKVHSKDINEIMNHLYNPGRESSGYTTEDKTQDSYLPWGTTLSAEEDLENKTKFLHKLYEHYDLFGPIEYKGDTIPIFTPVDAEVGDDHIKLHDAPFLFLSEMIAASECFNAQISEKDTFISSRYGNYSESYILKPDNLSELYQQMGTEGGDVSFLDIAKIRTIIPVSSMRQKHSDTVSGKVSLMGNQAIYGTRLCGFEIKVSQTLQYLSLGLGKEGKFPYMPTYLGGFGAPPPFQNERCLIRCFYSYKGGEYFRLLAGISAATFEAKFRSKEPLDFLENIKGNAESWQDWYTTYTKYVPTIKGDLDMSLYRKYLNGTLGRKSEVWDNAARRLLKLGSMVTKTQLLVHDHVDTLTQVLLACKNSIEVREEIENEKSLQRMETVFNSSMSRKLESYNPHMLEDEYLKTVLSLFGKGNDYLKSVLKGEMVFDAEALNHLKSKGPLMVNLGFHDKNGLGYPKNFENYVDPDLVDEIENLIYFVRGDIGIEAISQNLISDDEVLLAKIQAWSLGRELLDAENESLLEDIEKVKIAVITTKDIRMCKDVNQKTGVVVIRLDPIRPLSSREQIGKSILERYPNADIRFYNDTGSIQYVSRNTLRNKVRNERRRRGPDTFNVRFIVKKEIDPDNAFHRRLQSVNVVGRVLKPDDVFDNAHSLAGRVSAGGYRVKRHLTKW